MFVAVINKTSWHAVGEQIASLLTVRQQDLLRDRPGQARLADCRDEPVVEFNLLSDQRDLERLMNGFRMMARCR